jgi:hypothetical protein
MCLAQRPVTSSHQLNLKPGDYVVSDETNLCKASCSIVAKPVGRHVHELVRAPHESAAPKWLPHFTPSFVPREPSIADLRISQPCKLMSLASSLRPKTHSIDYK